MALETDLEKKFETKKEEQNILIKGEDQLYESEIKFKPKEEKENSTVINYF